MSDISVADALASALVSGNLQDSEAALAMYREEKGIEPGNDIEIVSLAPIKRDPFVAEDAAGDDGLVEAEEEAEDVSEQVEVEPVEVEVADAASIEDINPDDAAIAASDDGNVL